MVINKVSRNSLQNCGLLCLWSIYLNPAFTFTEMVTAKACASDHLKLTWFFVFAAFMYKRQHIRWLHGMLPGQFVTNTKIFAL